MSDARGTDAAPVGVRLMVWDRTCRGRSVLPGLSHAWSLGSLLYRGLGRFDGARGVSSWEEALDFLAQHRAGEPLAEVQFWGHGKWGHARIGAQPLDHHALRRDHPLHERLDAVGQRFTDARGLLWFRTCETFGAHCGQAFARDLADFLGCRVAGHTFIIGHLQSGLHSLSPGETPTWDPAEGLRAGTPEKPERAWWSRLRHPNTITCLRGTIPPGY